MAEIYTNETPQEVKEAKGLHLLTQSTPNGQKVQIMLEELAAVYGSTWTTTLIDISTNEQKKDWYLRLNPNGRIPTIVDNTKERPFSVMETSAELLYLVKKFDKDGLFTFDDELEYSQMLQWLFFWHGSGAPYQGQLGFFSRAAEKVPMAIERFRNETLRVFGVLEIQLSGRYSDGPREYLAGAGKGKYSIADIGTWTWISKWKLGGFKEEDMNAQFPHLLKWISRIGERGAVKTGTGSKLTSEKGLDGYPVQLIQSNPHLEDPVSKSTLAKFNTIGKFVKAIIKNSRKLNGKQILAATAYYTPKEILSTVLEATGKSTHFASVTPEQYKSFLPEAIAEEMLENHLFVEKPGYYNGAELDESLSILEDPQLLGRILSSRVVHSNDCRKPYLYY
ncbi:hypothetical protein D6C98_08133 [Aureobasidium pullulans]|nr:hypothetical protein D6C98_08133 [Aureobasidium pullulans]